MSVIEVENVSLRFGTVTAVDRVGIEVEAGEIVGLLGHNGAGKTTLLRVINGLLRPDEGRVGVLGMDPLSEGHLLRQRTGVLTEYPALDEYLSPAENLATYAAINRMPALLAGRRIDELLEALGLADKRDLPSRDLSAGLKQRVALARALVHDPEVLLLDEPTTNMDPVAARGVRRMIMDAARRRGHTVLLSTHNIAEAEELCDRVAIMRAGTLLSSGTPGRLRRSLGRARTVRIDTDPGQATTVATALGELADVAIVRDDVAEVSGGPPVPELVARLVDHGIAVQRVQPLEPTLEDLYLHLHGEQPLVEVVP